MLHNVDVIVTIGKIGDTSKLANDFAHITELDDVEWLSSVLMVSMDEAKAINDQLTATKNVPTFTLEIPMSYIQLARYTAKRRCENLHNYWKFPNVVRHKDRYNDKANSRAFDAALGDDEYKIKKLFAKLGIGHETDMATIISDHFTELLNGITTDRREQERKFAMKAYCYLNTALIETEGGDDRNGKNLKDRIENVVDGYNKIITGKKND